jgi:hypothetical protein
MKPEQLKELLHYEPETGVFTWRVSKGGKKAGSIAGCLVEDGYIRIKINKKLYPAHHLAWLCIYGELPENEIDHINHIRTDNSIGNLRSATRTENGRNVSLSVRNQSGVIGVCWFKGKWLAYIKVDGRQKTLGRFNDKFEAICCRKSANNKYGFHLNHGGAR